MDTEGTDHIETDQLSEDTIPLSPESEEVVIEVNQASTPRTSGLNKNIKNLRVNTADLNSKQTCLINIYKYP